MTQFYQKDTFTLDSPKITEEKHPVYGDITVFHDVVIASEIVQPYQDGLAYKPRDELEAYAWTADNRWVMVGSHPEDGIISSRDQISGRTVNPRYVKDLLDPKTGRPNRAGVRADVQIFNKMISPKTLEDMKNGKKQDVSIGFFYTKDETKGAVVDGPFKGAEYDYVQRNMFHDHLAAGIDAGRCPMPYCGLGADEIGRRLTGDPFAGFSSFSDCQKKIKEKNPDLSDEQVNAICGKLKSENEDNKGEDEAMRKTLRELAQMILDEMEEIKGMKDAKQDEKPWYFTIPWRDEPYITIYDALDEEVRQILVNEGLCPHCPADDEEPEESECEEGYEKNEMGECVPMKEEEEETSDEPIEEETPLPEKKQDKLDPFDILRKADSVLNREP